MITAILDQTYSMTSNNNQHNYPRHRLLFYRCVTFCVCVFQIYTIYTWNSTLAGLINNHLPINIANTISRNLLYTCCRSPSLASAPRNIGDHAARREDCSKLHALNAHVIADPLKWYASAHVDNHETFNVYFALHMWSNLLGRLQYIEPRRDDVWVGMP